jgi:hypothetical protein
VSPKQTEKVGETVPVINTFLFHQATSSSNFRLAGASGTVWQPINSNELQTKGGRSVEGSAAVAPNADLLAHLQLSDRACHGLASIRERSSLEEGYHAQAHALPQISASLPIAVWHCASPVTTSAR